MKQIGCTSPFGTNHEHICNDTNKAEKAMEFLLDTKKMLGDFNLTQCPFPCKLQIVQFERSYEVFATKKPKLILNFPQLIRETRSYVSYGALELIAEFGGYVGLFLGVSFCHLSDLFERILMYLPCKWLLKPEIKYNKFE